MIYLYSGTPGAGKSLHIANHLFWWVKRGVGIVTNFDFNHSGIRSRRYSAILSVDNENLTPELLKRFSREYYSRYEFREGGIKLVIDECQLIFNSREWNRPDRAEWLAFFTQHRKYGYDIFLVAQFDQMLDKQIRALIEYEVIHRKVANFGFWGSFFNIITGGKLFVAVTMWYPMKTKTSSEFFHARKKYYSLYDTYKLFNEEGENHGKQVGCDRSITIGLSDF